MTGRSSRRRMSITIDGPAGAGKSTVARRLARLLGYTYLDTGALYRALTWKALRQGVDVDDGAALAELLRQTDVQLRGRRVSVDGVDVTEAVRTPEVDRVVSRVAAHAEVRRAMLGLQRRMARGGGVVVDGRDAGTVILPWAERKFFLVASLEERARRRQRELERRGLVVDPEALAREMAERDRMDAERDVAPLRPAPDARIVDTTGRDVDDVVRELARLCRTEGLGARDRRRQLRTRGPAGPREET